MCNTLTGNEAERNWVVIMPFQETHIVIFRLRWRVDMNIVNCKSKDTAHAGTCRCNHRPAPGSCPPAISRKTLLPGSPHPIPHIRPAPPPPPLALHLPHTNLTPGKPHRIPATLPAQLLRRRPKSMRPKERIHPGRSRRRREPGRRRCDMKVAAVRGGWDEAETMGATRDASEVGFCLRAGGLAVDRRAFCRRDACCCCCCCYR